MPLYLGKPESKRAERAGDGWQQLQSVNPRVKQAATGSAALSVRTRSTTYRTKMSSRQKKSLQYGRAAGVTFTDAPPDSYWFRVTSRGQMLDEGATWGNVSYD